MHYLSNLTTHPTRLSVGLRLVIVRLAIAVLVTATFSTFNVSHVSAAVPAVASAAIPAPAVTTSVWSRTMSLNYCWGTMDPNDITPFCPCADLTLTRRPRSVDVYDCATGIAYPAAGTWSKTRRWQEVTFEFNGLVTYTGVKQADGSYEGIMFTTGGMFGVWRGELN